MWLARWTRLARALRRLLLLLPLVLTALALLLLPRPPPIAPPAEINYLVPPPMESGIRLGEIQRRIRHEKLDTHVATPSHRRPWFMKGGDEWPWFSNPIPNLFPESAVGEDRIVDQLIYTLPKDKDVPVKKILLANGLGSWNVPGGRTFFIRNKCPVDKCSLTAEPEDAPTADAILYKDHFISFGVRRPPSQIWILYYLECPYHTTSLRTSSSSEAMNWTATYRRDSDIVAPYEKWVYHDPEVTQKEVPRNYAAEKTKKVAWFVSNCRARNRRLQFALRLAKHIQVDIYGACGPHRCPRNDPNCLEMLNKDYKFYLAFENSNCKDYITEKFFVNGLQHDVIPIVMGARPAEYAAVAPHNSYIHVEEFADAEELAKYLHTLDKNDTLYNSYFKWKGTGEFINTFFFCRVCAMVHANEKFHRRASYKDVQAWWRNRTCTRDEWRSSSGIPQDDILDDDDDDDDDDDNKSMSNVIEDVISQRPFVPAERYDKTSFILWKRPNK